jgi:hypothetical protein
MKNVPLSINVADNGVHGTLKHRGPWYSGNKRVPRATMSATGCIDRKKHIKKGRPWHNFFKRDQQHEVVVGPHAASRPQ